MTEAPVDVDLARELWARGMSLGAIARQLDCSLHDLSPWLYIEEQQNVLRRATRWPRDKHRDLRNLIEEAWGTVGSTAERIDWADLPNRNGRATFYDQEADQPVIGVPFEHPWRNDAEAGSFAQAAMGIS